VLRSIKGLYDFFKNLEEVPEQLAHIRSEISEERVDCEAGPPGDSSWTHLVLTRAQGGVESSFSLPQFPQTVDFTCAKAR